MNPSKRILEFELPYGPQAHKESQIHPSGKFIYTPQEKKDYMRLISDSLSDYKGYFKGCMCLRVTILFVCARPAASPSYIPSGLWDTQTEFRKGTRPDLDNYLKPLQDGMSNHIIDKIKHPKTGDVKKILTGAGVIDDDSCIVSLRADKIYAMKGRKPQMEIKIEELSIFYVR